MAGWKDGKIVIGPHILGRFVIDPREAVDTFYGKKKPRTREMALGEDIHRKLGYTNEQLFEKEAEVGGVKVVVRGVPDYIDGERIEELKTVGGKYVSNRYLDAAEVQMLAYLWLTDRPNGEVVVVRRDTLEEVERFHVFRDDERLFKIMGDFVKEIKNREKASNLLVSFLKAQAPGQSRT